VRPAGRGRPTDQADVRRHNAALVLDRVAQEGPISRARVAAHTGLTRATVGTIVDELIAAGLVTEQGTRAPSGVGRPGTDLALCPDGAAGVDLSLIHISEPTRPY
jgi:predicted ArsR family transcriptional regulator